MAGCGGGAATTIPDQAASAPTTTPISALTAVVQPTTISVAPTFAPPTSDYKNIAEVALQTAKQNNPNRPTVVGITGIEGEYAAAVAYPFGERPHYIYLQRTAGTWQVLMATAIPSSNALQQAGVPASLGSSSDADLLIGGFVGTYAEQMQPPRTTGLEGTVVVEGQIGDYARLFFTPADPATVDPLTAFWQRKDGRWQQLTAGSGFDEAMLQQFGIPPQLWKKPLY